MTTREILVQAKSGVAELTRLSGEERNKALSAMAESLLKNEEQILAANREDLESVADSMGDVMKDRLRLSHERILQMSKGILEVMELPDPLGRILERVERPNGLRIEKVSVPLGVVAMIYESRPNVTSDAAALCFKSGNVCVLRGGKEAYRTSRAIVDALRSGLSKLGYPGYFINMLEDTTREGAKELMTATGLVDLLIPRGGAGLISACVEGAKVPCIQTGTGICHIYVDQDADLEKALSIVENAKTSRPSVCNAEEVLIVHEKVAKEFLPKLKKRLQDDRISKGLVPVELRLDPAAALIIDGKPAGEKDFDTEFLDYILAVCVVKDVKEAISHIAKHSTHHSEAIITENKQAEEAFLSSVDSAAVYVNASTRFTDGGEFGLGCELGISTQKLHARGPMGLREMTTYKYIIHGNGQIR